MAISGYVVVRLKSGQWGVCTVDGRRLAVHHSKAAATRHKLKLVSREDKLTRRRK